HCLLRRGLSSRRALAWVAGFCLLAAAGALASTALNNDLLALVSAAAVVAILVAARIFGHAEVSLCRQRLGALGASFLRPRGASAPRVVQVRLQGDVEWQELWNWVIACARQMNLQAVRLDVNAPAINEGYHARWDRPHVEGEYPTLWRAEVPLVAH